MLHPSYSELMERVNDEGVNGEALHVNSRYSIVIATSKRARELISGKRARVEGMEGEKPLSIAVKELYESEISILPEGAGVSEEPEEILEAADEEMITAEESDAEETEE